MYMCSGYTCMHTDRTMYPWYTHKLTGENKMNLLESTLLRGSGSRCGSSVRALRMLSVQIHITQINTLLFMMV